MQVLRQKPEKLEDVHEQRKFIDGLPQAIGTLMQDIESTRVGVPTEGVCIVTGCSVLEVLAVSCKKCYISR